MASRIYFELTSDEQLRRRALELAVEGEHSAEGVVKRAEKYYDFLIGKKDESE